MLIVLVLALISVCVAQTPTPCTVPSQWESRVFSFDRKRGFGVFAKFTYDATMERTRTIEEVDQTGKEREFYDVLRLHQQRKEYTLNLRTKKCNTTTLDRPFIPIHIPHDAKFDFAGEIGPASIPGEHVPYQVWEGNFTRGSFKAHFYTTVSQPSCDPLNFDMFMEGGEHFGQRFFDFVEGIPDPAVFIPPSECSP